LSINVQRQVLPSHFHQHQIPTEEEAMSTSSSAKTAKGATKRRITFTLVAPEAKAVAVTGSFCDWQPSAYPLNRDANGKWKRIVTLVPGRYEYQFIVDDAWRVDPDCPERVGNPFGGENCVLNVN
jgi:1,4-alpha-glucan branching enzyme